MNDSYNFAVFILTNGRPESVHTYKTLKRQGFTGKIFIIIDDDDPCSKKYRDIYDECVISFNKDIIGKTFDLADNFDNKNVIVFARNACFKIAKELGIDYFLMLDDDYKQFRYTHDSNLDYVTRRIEIKNLDRFFNNVLSFYIESGATSIAIGQGGDFIGGNTSNLFKNKILRKCMNSFFCATSKPFKFVGRINEDVNTYINLGSIGYLFFTLSMGRLEQIDTQTNSGGMTDIYKQQGTYVKSFYTLLFRPSCVKISTIGVGKRFHHLTSWNYAVPKIIDQKYKK